VAAATGLSDAFTERADGPAAARSHPKHQAEGSARDPPVFIGTRPTDPICTVTDRCQVDPDDAPNAPVLHCSDDQPRSNVLVQIGWRSG